MIRGERRPPWKAESLNAVVRNDRLVTRSPLLAQLRTDRRARQRTGDVAENHAVFASVPCSTCGAQRAANEHADGEAYGWD